MHPNKQKCIIQSLLQGGAVATTAQLERLGVSRGAELLALPNRTISMKTSKDHIRTLTFTALKDGTLERPTRDLGHRAAQFELAQLYEAGPLEWADVHRTNHGIAVPNSFPDWLLFNGATGRFEVSVEVDVGYSRKRVEEKVRGVDREWRTPRYLYATSIPSRVAWFTEMVSHLHAGDEVRHLQWAEAFYVDFWSATDPYGYRPFSSNLNHSRWAVSQDGQSESV